MRDSVGRRARTCTFELLENGSEAWISFDLFGYARVHRVVTVDADLICRVVGEVESDSGVSGGSRDSFQDFANNL